MSGTRKSNLLGKITVLFVICCCSLSAHAKYGGGSGEPNDPYLIYTAEQMNQIGLGVNCDDWDKHFKLMADIDLIAYTGTSFNIIGYYVGSWQDDRPFRGVFDGNGYTISNFIYASTDSNCIGLFGYVNGTIKDLGLIDPDVDAGEGSFVGSLAGWFRYGTITNCYVDGAAVAGSEGVGGLVGQNGLCYHAGECGGGTILNCYSTGSVSGYSAVGGIMGKSNGGTISNCYSESIVSGTTEVGGLLGLNDEGIISNSYSNSDVSGEAFVGGLVGTNFYMSTVSNSYSSGSVSGDADAGGLAGANSGQVSICFWDIESSGQTTSAGGTGKTTAEMQDQGTFMDAGWDFVGEPDGPHDVWAEPVGGGYPILCWQLPPLFGLPGFSGGSGTAEDPYLISTVDELNSIGHNPRLMAAHFKLIDDIDLTGTDLFLIGSELFPFRGVFDGNGRKISYFTYSSTDADGIGLFTYVYGESALIKDLGLIDPEVEVWEGFYLGSLIGRLFKGNVTNCYVDGGSISGRFCAGGLVGSINRGTIDNCRITASVSGYFYVGGLIGNNDYGVISNCDSGADVYGDYFAGGLVGYNYFDSTITNCHTTGTVSGGGYVGGLMGHNYATITNCHTTGTVSGSGTVGGLAGRSSYGAITDCYTTGDVSGGDFVGGLVGEDASAMTNCYAAGAVRGEYNVGGLAGRYSYSTINDCYATGDVSGTGWSVGGLVGKNESGTISKCYAKGSASGKMYVGGLAGWNEEGTISYSYSTGGVSGTRSNVGGFVGSNYGDGTVTNCYSTGSVVGDEDVGGFAGSNGGKITNCYSTGGVSGYYDIGGLVGENGVYGIVSSSFWDV
jgi:hypothetical protein